jgi:hypothetical protein
VCELGVALFFVVCLLLFFPLRSKIKASQVQFVTSFSDSRAGFSKQGSRRPNWKNNKSELPKDVFSIEELSKGGKLVQQTRQSIRHAWGR